MRKRFLCCIIVLVILTVSLVPVFGIGVGEPAIDEVAVQAGIQFDTLTFLDGDNSGTVVSWPFNEAYGHPAYVVQEHYEDGYRCFSAAVFKQSNSITGFFSSGNASAIRLDSRVMYFNRDSTMYLIGDIQGISFKRIRISYDFISIKPNSLGTDYVADETRVDLSSSLSSADQYLGVSIGSLIASAYWHTTGNEFPEGDQLLANVKVEISYSDPDDVGFSVSVSTAESNTDFFGSWVRGQKLKSSGEDSNMLTWLLNTADAFLQLEIFPGFSLGGIFSFVIIILVILILLKIFS